MRARARERESRQEMRAKEWCERLIQQNQIKSNGMKWNELKENKVQHSDKQDAYQFCLFHISIDYRSGTQCDCSNFCMENCYTTDKTMRYSVNPKQSFDYCSRFTINKLKKKRIRSRAHTQHRHVQQIEWPRSQIQPNAHKSVFAIKINEQQREEIHTFLYIFMKEQINKGRKTNRRSERKRERVFCSNSNSNSQLQRFPINVPLLFWICKSCLFSPAFFFSSAFVSSLRFLCIGHTAFFSSYCFWIQFSNRGCHKICYFQHFDLKHPSISILNDLRQQFMPFFKQDLSPFRSLQHTLHHVRAPLCCW